MTKKLLFSIVVFSASFTIVGCGGSGGEAGYDPAEAAPYTEADEQAAADYDAQMAKEMEEQYGK